MDDKPYKPPPTATQFGDLTERVTGVDAKHEELRRTLAAQDKEMRDIKTQGRLTIKQVEEQAKEVLLVKQTANRTEAKVDKIGERSEAVLDALDVIKKVFVFFEWCGKRLLPVLGTIGTIAGAIAYFKH